MSGGVRRSLNAGEMGDAVLHGPRMVGAKTRLMDLSLAGTRDRLRRLYWVGPAAVATSVLAVSTVQAVAVQLLSPLPRFSEAILTSNEPPIVTAILVSAAVVVFAVCVHLAADPLRRYRQIALGALLISFVPNVLAALLLKPAADWPSMIALMVMHVTAWAVTVTMLTWLGGGCLKG